uniref:Salivary secreted basic tail protein n=1 Tax=Hyalomma rufipes TaxID=72862 RepID=E2J6S4_HYARU
MNVFNVLLALVFLAVTDKAVGDDTCGNKTRSQAPNGDWPGCVYYCLSSSGWDRGFFVNGSWCMYTYGVNGTCYNGYCYKALPEEVTLPATDETPEPVTTQSTTTESTTVDIKLHPNHRHEREVPTPHVQITEVTESSDAMTETDATTTNRPAEEKKKKSKKTKKPKKPKDTKKPKEGDSDKDKEEKKKKKKREKKDKKTGVVVSSGVWLQILDRESIGDALFYF